MNFEKYIIIITLTIVGLLLYYVVANKNEKKRDKGYEGYICGRCKQGFEATDLYPVWQFFSTPLRMLFWDTEKELDICYCKSCRNIMNVMTILSLVITIPILFLLVVYVGNLFGLIS